MQAGFSRTCVNPLVGDPMEGLGQPNSTGIHDDLYLGSCWVTHAGIDALIIGCDLLFFERKDVDRFKGALGRKFNLLPKQILINTSHNHAGPRLTHWAYSDGAEPLYLDQVEDAILRTAETARANRRPARLAAGTTRCTVPMSRRLINADGQCEWAPSEDGPTCTALPVCHITDDTDKTIALLFSVSCHPSTWYDTSFSADFPGVAQNLLNRHFNTEGALFLQGAGGDTKARTIGEHSTGWARDRGFEAVERAGKSIAEAVMEYVPEHCRPVEPQIACVDEDMLWPLQTPPDRATFETLVARHRDGQTHQDHKTLRWAAEMLRRLDRFGVLPSEAPVGLHGLQLGRGLRLVGLEGEAVAELGHVILNAYDRGVTFPLSYTNGARLYLPVSRMHAEGGYEIESFYEYHWPAQLMPGEENILAKHLRSWRDNDILANSDT